MPSQPGGPSPEGPADIAPDHLFWTKRIVIFQKKILLKLLQVEHSLHLEEEEERQEEEISYREKQGMLKDF